MLRVLQNRVLSRILGPRRAEVTREWRKPHNRSLMTDECSTNIVRVIKSRRMRWAGHVARMGWRRCVYRVLVGKSEERDHVVNPRIDGRIY